MLSQTVKQISVEDVHQSVLDEKQVIFLDVRTIGEYERGHIKNSINLPVDDLEAKIVEIIPEKNKMIYAYCLSGARSNVAVNILSQLGYSNAFSMANGLLKWRANKFELVS